MSDLDKHVWTKRELASVINQRVDRSTSVEFEYVMPNNITDEILENFQRRWDSLSSQPAEREREVIRVYHSIIQLLSRIKDEPKTNF